MGKIFQGLDWLLTSFKDGPWRTRSFRVLVTLNIKSRVHHFGCFYILLCLTISIYEDLYRQFIIAKFFLNNEIDGDALFNLTERATELLLAIIGHRMKFLQALEKLKNGEKKRERESSPSEIVDLHVAWVFSYNC